MLKRIIILPSVYYILLIFIIGLFVFNKTFNLSLFGDEWQMIWVVKGSFETTGRWDYGIKQFNWQGYQFGALIMHLLTESFGYDGKAIYLFSFISRYFASLALFYFLLKRNLSNKIAFIGALCFMLSPVGLQTTDWAKNFTSYISIAFFILCINSIYNLRSLRSILIFLAAFSFSIYVNAIRAHGIIITVFFLLLFQMLFNKFIKKRNILFLFIAAVIIILIFSKMMVFADSDNIRNYIIEKSVLVMTQIFNGNFQKIEDLFILIGRGLLPDTSIIFISLLMLTILLWKNYLLSKKFLLPVLIFNITFLFLVFRYSPVSKDLTTMIVGVYFSLFIVTAFLIELFSKKPIDAMNSSVPFLLSISFIIISWIFGNTDVTESTHRYLIYPALSIPIIVAFSLNSIFSDIVENKLFFPLRLRVFSSYVPLFLLFMLFSSLRSEINSMYIRHNQETNKVLWQQITSQFDNLDLKNRRIIVFFTSDNEPVLHDSVLFGFNYRLGLIYGIWEEDKLPVAVDSPKDLKSLVSDGKASYKYIQKEYIFPKENAFYFKVENNKVVRVDISNWETLEN